MTRCEHNIACVYPQPVAEIISDLSAHVNNKCIKSHLLLKPRYH